MCGGGGGHLERGVGGGASCKTLKLEGKPDPLLYRRSCDLQYERGACSVFSVPYRWRISLSESVYL